MIARTMNPTRILTRLTLKTRLNVEIYYNISISIYPSKGVISYLFGVLQRSHFLLYSKPMVLCKSLDFLGQDSLISRLGTHFRLALFQLRLNIVLKGTNLTVKNSLYRSEYWIVSSLTISSTVTTLKIISVRKRQLFPVYNDPLPIQINLMHLLTFPENYYTNTKPPNNLYTVKSHL